MRHAVLCIYKKRVTYLYVLACQLHTIYTLRCLTFLCVVNFIIMYVVQYADALDNIHYKFITVLTVHFMFIAYVQCISR